MVIKRDGRSVQFDREKIVRAVEAAMKETELGVDSTLSNFIADKVPDDSDMSVEQIQDAVEDLLMKSDRRDVAKKYILYRAERTKQREMNNGLMNRVRERIEGGGVVNANANVDERSFGGRMNEAASIVQKTIALEINMSPDVAQAHKDGLIYHHDLDKFNIGMHNCLFLDFAHLFKNGFSTRNGDVRPPTSFSTACQLVAVAFQIQSQCQYGGVGSVHIDTDLAPFVAMSFKRHFRDGQRYMVPDTTFIDDGHVYIGSEYLKDNFPKVYAYAVDMLEREGKQAAQGLYHNLNTLESRAGSQVPFTSINLGRDTSTEGRLVTRWLLEASIEGIGQHHVTSIFPISIFSYKKGVNVYPTDPNYDLKQLALKSLSKRIYPNFASGDYSEAHEDADNPDTIFATMGWVLQLI